MVSAMLAEALEFAGQVARFEQGVVAHGCAFMLRAV
jgi:hypothetical protein